MGDANPGIKWNLRLAAQNSHLPALGASLYIEFPTGDRRQQLSSKRADYSLNFIVEESLSRKIRMNINSGFLFAGNTSTGALGIEITRGHVFPGGISLLRDFNSRLTLNGALYGCIANNDALGEASCKVCSEASTLSPAASPSVSAC